MAAKKQTAPSTSTRQARPSQKVPAKKALTTSKASARPATKPLKATKPVKAAAPLKATKPSKSDEPARVKGLALDAGSPAPPFTLEDEKGAQVSSSSLAGKPYLLYFYPKDDTPGCTKEACDIRDNFGRFGKLGLRVLGVSPDSRQSHAKFGQKYGLPFTLLSDPDKTLANAYGVWGEKSNYGKKYLGIIRSTFLIGGDGVVRKAYRGVKVNGHVDALLEDAKLLL